MQAYLFNMISPPDHEDYRIHLWAGNILSQPFDFLLTSAFRGAFKPLPNTVLGELYHREGLQLSAETGERISEHLLLFKFKPTAGGSSKKILVTEFLSTEQEDPFNVIIRRFEELRTNMHRALDGSERRLSMPLLGTGRQHLPKDMIASNCIALAESMQDTSLEEFNIFLYDFESIALVNQKINISRNRRPISATRPLLLKAVTEELQQFCEGSNPHRAALQIYLQMLQASQSSVESVATCGRKLCEYFAAAMMQQYALEPATGKLEDRLKALTPVLLEGGKGYLLSYLRLLQSCGNIAAHRLQSGLCENDIAAITIALLRLSAAAA